MAADNDEPIPAFLRLTPQQRRAGQSKRAIKRVAKAARPFDPYIERLTAERDAAEKVHKAAKRAAAKAAREYEIAHVKLARRIARIEGRQVFRSGSLRWDGRLGRYVEDK